MSPSPSMLNCNESTGPRGNRSLMGASNDLATDTITGVQNTQKMSYTNRPTSMIAPTWTDPSDRCSIPCTENARPRRLLASQCFFTQYHMQKHALTTPVASSGQVHSMSMSSFMMTGSFFSLYSNVMSRSLFGKNGSTNGSIDADSANVPSSRKYAERQVFTRSFGSTVNIMNRLKSTALPTIGMRRASCLDILSSSGTAAGFTDRQLPVRTASEAVTITLTLGSTRMNRGRTLQHSSAQWIFGHGNSGAGSAAGPEAVIVLTAAPSGTSPCFENLARCYVQSGWSCEPHGLAQHLGAQSFRAKPCPR
mmetsp:Transcript_47323/g.120773  ORF Transcript_47323/g.120773 Transcript_47323/m.120773 type:complete len:308 (+) Transcript_47323:499-1422(+)